MPMLSPHFSIEELSVTQQVDERGHVLGNIPGPIETLYLRILAETVLEPIRKILGLPLRVTSGYRSPSVEMKVSGKMFGQHMKGQAADILPDPSMSIERAYKLIWASDVPYDQLLLEGTPGRQWIHVSCAPTFDPPRRQALVSQDGRAWAVYAPQATDHQA